MSVTALAWALRQRCGSPITKAVLLVLADAANDDDRTWLSTKTICQRAEIAPRTFRTHRGKLEELGLVTTEERIRENGSQTSNYYMLHLDGGVARDAAPSDEAGVGRPDGATPEESSSDPPPLSLGLGDETDYDDLLDRLWLLHPRGAKRGRGSNNAFAQLKRAVPSKISGDLIVYLLRRYVDDELHDGFSGVHLWRWIRDQRWEQERAKGPVNLAGDDRRVMRGSAAVWG